MRVLPVHTFWRRFTLRHARTEWLQTSMLLLLLALGVGTFLSIRLANRSAVEGFRLFTESLQGESDWIVEATAGAISFEEMASLRHQLDPLPATIFPVVERSLIIPAAGTGDVRRVRLLGLDLVQIQAASGESTLLRDANVWELLDSPEHLVISQSLANDLGIEVGDTLDCIVESRPMVFFIKGILPEYRNNQPIPENLVVADLGSLINRLGLEAVDRVEVIIPEGPSRVGLVAQIGQRLREIHPSGWKVSSPRQRQFDGASMTSAFRLNLTVLSLIAMLVGMYLIAQTLDATVSRRRREIATLRSLGVPPSEIQRLWLSEAILYGILAGLLGLFVGYLLAHFTVDAVTQTVEALYRDTVESGLRLNWQDIAICLGLGIVGSLVAAWIPARDAASTPPAQFLRIGKRIPPFPVFQHPLLGMLMLGAGALLLLVPPLEAANGYRIPVAGYAVAILWLTGGTLVAVRLINSAGLLIAKLAPHRAVFRLAGSRLQQPTSRHQLALSGFFVAIGMAAAMAFMIASFDHTVTSWLKQRLRADLFISSIGFQGADEDPTMPGDMLDAIEEHPAVNTMDRFASIPVDFDGVPASLGGVRFDLLGTEQKLLWIQAPPEDFFMPAGADAIAYINENLQRKMGWTRGDVISISTPVGEKSICIAGIHADYARDNGLLLVNLPKLQEWYGINHYATASIFLHPEADPSQVQEALKAAYPGLAIRQNGELMETALFIFKQTFSVTYALQVIGLFVALAGLFLSLLSLLRESAGELYLQQALGMSRREIAVSTALEGTGVAMAGLLSGLALSVALGWVLIFIINRQSFGWTLQTSWPAGTMLALSGAVILLGFSVSFMAGFIHLNRNRNTHL